MILLLSACAPHCDEGEIRRDGECVAFAETAPTPRGDAWAPSQGTPWQIQYTGTLDPSLDVEVWDVDLFDTSDEDWAALEGRGRICYFSAGSWEDWRPDADAFPPEARGNALDGWPGEWWLDITRTDVRDALEARLDRAVERGCDAVDPDNVNGWENPTGLAITEDEQVDFNRFLADAAHARGLGIALKNDQLQLDRLSDWFDLAVNEECIAYDECGAYDAFVESGKAVLQIEYVDDWADAEARAAEVCPERGSLDTLVKTWELGAERLGCP